MFFPNSVNLKICTLYCTGKNVNINVLFKHCLVSEYTKTIVLKKKR